MQDKEVRRCKTKVQVKCYTKKLMVQDIWQTKQAQDARQSDYKNKAKVQDYCGHNKS